MALGILIGLVILAIILYFLYAIALEFYNIAVSKGYDERKYLWYCFFFGVAGYLLVMALPEKNEKAYNFAKSCIDDGRFFEAYKIYEELGTYQDSETRCKEAYLQYLVFEINVEDYYCDTDGLRDEYGATDISAEKMRKILTSSSWVTRLSDDSSYYTKFYEDGIISNQSLGSAIDHIREYKSWSILDSNKFKFVSNSQEKYYSFLKLADGLFLACEQPDEVDEECIAMIFIKEGSKWFNRYIEHYDLAEVYSNTIGAPEKTETEQKN